MLEGLDDELKNYLAENPRIVPLFDIDVIETVGAYTTPVIVRDEEGEPDTEILMEFHRAQDTSEWEMEISQRVTMSLLEEIYIGTANAPRSLSILEELPPSEKAAMVELLHEYKDVFAWSHEDIEGLDPKFYQHKINLVMDAKPV